MSLPTTLSKPYTMVSGTDALAADVNGDFDYAISALNDTNTQVNTNTSAIATLDTSKIGTTALDADGTLAANSDAKIATQKAVKTYVDTEVAGAAIAAMPISYLDADGTLAANSDVKVPSQKAVKTLVAATAFSTVLPAQTGNAGKFVTTDGTDARWATITIPPQAITYELRTSNTMLSSADNAKFINITSGTFSQTFDTSANLGSGFWCYLKNSGTGNITLDPASTETIDGLATYPMYPGECRLVMCNGSGLLTQVVQPFYRAVTASETLYLAPGYSLYNGLLWGAGGGGGKGGAGNASGGGGGACVPVIVTASGSYPVVIGAGGAAVTSIASGGTGGNSTFAGITAYGGGGGFANGSANNAGGSGGGALSAGVVASDTAVRGGLPSLDPSTASLIDNHGFGGAGCFSNQPGNAAWGGGAGAGTNSGAKGGQSIYGGGGGSCSTASTTGGVSVYGGNGGAGYPAASGTNGAAPAGGGGGTGTGATSGAGGRGELRIWGVI